MFILAAASSCGAGIITNGSSSDVSPIIPSDSLTVESFDNAYISGGNNSLGLVHGDNGTLRSIAAADGTLSISTGVNANEAAWNTTVGTPCFDATPYTGIAFTLKAPVGTQLTIRLAGHDASCGAETLMQDVSVPLTAITGRTQWVVMNFAHFGVTELADINSISLTGFSDNVTYNIGAIYLLGGQAPQSLTPPASGTTLDLPDPNFGDGSGNGNAVWMYDTASLAGSAALGDPPYDTSNAAWSTMQQFITAGAHAWSDTLSVTNRPYTVSGESGNIDNDGDRFKLVSTQGFGTGTYTWRAFTPLNADGSGGERTSTAAWVLCKACTTDVVPEIDFECGFGDGSDVRKATAATADQIVCQMTIVDGSSSGAKANPMAVAGDAWHQFSMTLSDDGKSVYSVGMAIDGNTVTWPRSVSSNPNGVDLGATPSRWSSAGGYGTDVRFNALISVEHLQWMGSQNAVGYNSAYFDWFNQSP